MRLCTFSGKFGDVLWSLATVRQLAIQYNEPLDFACMPQYESLLPLIQSQSYVKDAFVIKNWICEHSNFGDQPWLPPLWKTNADQEYEQAFHLTYRTHPAPTPLALFIAQQQGVTLTAEPFLEVDQAKWIKTTEPYVAYAFNPEYCNEKAGFLAELPRTFPDLALVRVDDMPWKKAALWIKNALGFIGCRSSNYVLSHGVGQRVLCFEPNPWRREATYGYPFGIEVMCMNAETAISALTQWREP